MDDTDLSARLEGHPERIVPDETEPGIVALHLKRYAFAREWALGGRVLDAACGVGYGSAFLAEAARDVVGVDTEVEAISYASRRYQAPNVEFVVGDVTALPFADRSFDLVCSFETIEHVRHPTDALDEFARVVADDGVLVASTPNAPRTTHTPTNPHHHVELDRRDFERVLQERFAEVTIYGQHRRRTRRHRIAQRLDVLGLRRRVKRGGFAVRLVATAPMAQLTFADIEILAGNTDGASELIAVCRAPHRR